MNAKNSTIRWWDFLAAACLMIAILASATRLTVTRWTAGLEHVQYLTFFAVILGLALGQSKFSPALARVFAVAYSIFAIPWQLASLQAESVAWNERLVSLGGRIMVAASQISRGRPVDDSILFITLMAILFWIIGVTAGYFLTRHGNVWASLIPAGVAIFVVNHYDPLQPTWGPIVGVFLFFSLILLMRVTFLRYREEWVDRGITQAPETGFELARIGLVVVVIVVLLAWNVPALAQSSDAARSLWVRITHPWEVFRDTFSDAVASLRSTVGVVSDFYGDELALGTGTNLGADVIFSVKPNLAPPENTRFYWRARSYDEYSTQDGWQTTVKAVDEFVPDVQGEQLDYPSWDGLQRIEFRFNPQVSLLRTMYTASQPIWVSRPVNVIYGIVPGGAHDISTVQANPPLRAGESYTAVSMIGSPTITALRGSGDLYPEWVRERYLRLPENFSPAVQALANQITQGLDNPYDKVEAVTRYLRENITYTTTVGSPPEGMDPIEWFLFELQAGYCNYYASAEVLLLRSIGIPARLAAGFAQGEVNAESGGYVVRQRDAHAWPEVYFNEYGWVEFEPTVSQPARQLPLGEDSDPTGSETITQLPDALAQIDEGPLFDPENVYGRNTIDLEAIQEAEMVRQRNRAYTLAFGGVSLLVLAYLAWRILQNRFQAPPLPVFLEESLIRHGRRAPAWLISWARSFRYTPIQKAYNGINRSLNILSVKVPQSATPREREQALTDHLPAVHEAGTRIIEEYHRETYGQTRGDASRVTGVAKMMQNLALRTRLAQIYAKIVKRKGTSQAENK